MRKIALNGGAEEDRTPDLLIANVAVTYNINDLGQSSRLLDKPKMAHESTNRAQSYYMRATPSLGERA